MELKGKEMTVGSVEIEKKVVIDQRELPKSSHPWLFHEIQGKDQEQRFHNIFAKDQSFTLKNPYLKNKYVWSESCYGWWVVQDRISFEPCFLLNPCSMERIELPKVEKCLTKCILTDSPKNPDCRVLFFTTFDVLLCRLRDMELKEMDLSPGEEHYGSFCSASVVGGKVYVLLCVLRDHSFRLMKINLDFGKDSVEIVKVMTETETSSIHLSAFGPWKYQDYLIESNINELLHIRVFYSLSLAHEISDIKIRKLDCSSSHLKWELLESIGEERAILIDGHTGFMCDIDKEGEIEGNCVCSVSTFSNHVTIFCLESGCVSYLSLSTPPAVKPVYFKHMFCTVRLP